MSNCSDNKNPLQHNGTSQAERLLPGLQAGYVQVNEKDYADWIVFAGEFAAYLNYYDATGTSNGNWQTFFTSDISALLGSIAIQDIDGYRRPIKERFDFIKNNDNAGNLNAVMQKLHELFSVVLSISKALDRYLHKLPEYDVEEENRIAFKGTLKNIIETKLAPALQRLLAYYKAAVAEGFLLPGDFTGWKVLNTPVQAAEVIISNGLSKTWWRNGASDWSTYIGTINADSSIFGDILWNDFRRINQAANHNLFASIFDQYTQSYTKAIAEATKNLLATLENWNTHPAHYALFLAFLKLFRFAQADINTITQRHLDFYYKEVLQLLPKAAMPNKAHILVELAKMTDGYALGEGTTFKAGKDSAGKEVLYALDRTTTFNKAKIAQLKSVYLGDASLLNKDNHPLTAAPLSPTVVNSNRLFAAAVANSDDGLGAALTTPHKEWHPYVNKKYAEAKLTDIATPNASIGFTIASHYLYLTEGERKIIIRLDAGSGNGLLYNKAFDYYLTTEKEWLAIPSTAVTAIASGGMTDSTPCAELTITLHGDAPAITNYVATVHGGTLNVQVPVLKMVLKNTDDTPYEYDNLKNVKIKKIEVKVEVGNVNVNDQTGIKQLLLANDFGPLDPAQPFQPFGPLPVAGNRLVIGSKEVFSKKNTDLRLNIEWKDVTSFTYSTVAYGTQPDGAQLPNAIMRHLRNGIWEAWGSGVEIFSAPSNVDATVTLPYYETAVSNDIIVDYHDEYEGYNINANKGYIALQLTEGFGHKNYQLALTTYLINKANGMADASNPLPVEPYTPVIQSLYLSYTANKIEVFSSTAETDTPRYIQFFHDYPFGEAEQWGFQSATGVYLLPQFKHGETPLDRHIGEFYIGIEELQAQQVVNILFQVMEGTADPTIAKPDKHVYWSYLSNNEWKNFDEKTISDATRQLVQSGIISFVIPADATTANTILPTGYIWLKAAVTEYAEAVCKLLSIDAQAALVTFTPNNNADDFLNKSLPAASITKLKVPDSAVKKIEQRYTSFGGRAKEQENQFYVRVSERLRHKNRAITIWDYEHLVLENFQQIYKAKCLNHTRTENPETGDPEYNEVAPGYVTVITIPDLQNRNDTNPLRPYTNQNTLLEIEEFLKKKISCHVNLKVRNPQFEEVRLKFKMKLLKGYDDFTYYYKQLQQEITQFLTPWAYTGDADISFGGKVYKSVLIDFIEERPYVDFITDVEMYHRPIELGPETDDLDEIVASTARSILVSAQASRHEIDEITIEELEEAAECNGGAAPTHH
ncbi:hypothetical protein FAM09_00295 [Niastella caeni]|uniref:Baseplate protein J-like domain-containing protein n=1 Tax=Niastella caeni TaxID=2569763 RepID=A0A4S8HY48_9BACT|nr:hypothetical protein [Niastella caeni]THU40590.1 hypothetical protein FAM09_00295 [Niastella caeni]